MNTTSHTVHEKGGKEHKGVLFDKFEAVMPFIPTSDKVRNAYTILKPIKDRHPNHFIRLVDLNAITGLRLRAKSKKNGSFSQRFPGCVLKNICYPELVTGNTKGMNGYFVSVRLTDKFLTHIQNVRTLTGKQNVLHEIYGSNPKGEPVAADTSKFKEIPAYGAMAEENGKEKKVRPATVAKSPRSEQKQELRNKFLDRLTAMEHKMDVLQTTGTTNTGLIGRLIEQGKIDAEDIHVILDTLKNMRMDLNDMDTQIGVIASRAKGTDVHLHQDDPNLYAKIGMMLNGVGMVVIGLAAAGFVYLLW